METLRILQAYEVGPPHGGECVDGVGVMVTSLSKKLAEMGHEVTFLTGQTCPKSPSVEYAEGYKIVRTDAFGALSRSWDPVRLGPVRGICFPFSLALDGRNIRGQRFDVMNAHLYTAALAVASMSARAGIPIVDTVHGTYSPAWGNVESDALRRWTMSSAERLLLPMVARISSIQVHAAEYSRMIAVRWGVAPQRLLTIVNGVDLGLFAEGSHSREGTARIFCARRLVRKNGLDVLVRAMGLLRDCDARLVIAGVGPERESLGRLVVQLGLQGRVEFVGAVPHSKIATYLTNSDIAVVPSFIEATSLFILESMAAGVPVVASAVGGVLEVLRNEMDGLLVPPGDPVALAGALRRLVEDETLAKRFSSSGKKRVADHFSLDKMAARYVSTYARVLGGDGS